MKRILFLTVALVISVFPSVTLGAEFTNHGPKILKPSSNTEKVFKKVTQTAISNEEDVIRIKGEMNEGTNGVEAYNIKIDEDKGTYTATSMKGKRLKSMQAELENSDTAGASHYRSVTAITDDPRGEDLAKHTHKLNFTSNGKKASYKSRSKSAWAVNPSSIDTHWYVDENKFTGLRYIDGNRTIESKSRAKFHNYDFGSDSKITRVTHYITIEGWKTGKSNYDVDWARSGDFYQILDLDIATNSK